MRTRFNLTLGLFIAFLCGGRALAATYDQCAYALNKSAANALSVSGSSTVSASGCGLIVDSSSGTALNVSGSSKMTAKYLDVAGGDSITGSSTISPVPQLHSSAQSDPLAFLAAPTSSHCDYTNFKISGSSSTTINPGTYCNGITISGSAKVTVNSGMYILMGGGLKVSGSNTLTGTGVTFFLTQGLGYSYGSLSVSGSPVMSLSAPTSISSPYYGILLFQDRSIPSGSAASSISGSSNAHIEGAFYFPTTGLNFSGSSNDGSYLILVADTLTVSGSGVIKLSFPSSRSPLEPPVSVALAPPVVTLSPGQSQPFTPTVTNSSEGVTWSLSPSGIGTISASGLYTAPGSISAQQTVNVTATSQEDTTKSASAAVTLMPLASIPVVLSVAPGSGQQGQQNLPVTVTGNFTHFSKSSVVTFANGAVTAGAPTAATATSITVPVSIAASATPGATNVTVTTGAEVVTLANGFTVSAGTAALTKVTPSAAQQGTTNVPVTITGAFTHFSLSSVVTFANGAVTAGVPTAATVTSLTVPVSVMGTASLGATNVTVMTGSEVVTLSSGFTVTAGTPAITMANPDTAQQGSTSVPVTITGNFTHFSSSSVVTFANGAVTAGAPATATATSLTVPVSITASATLGATNVTVATGAEVATLANGFTVSAGTPVFTSANPNSGQQGASGIAVTITGNFTHFSNSSVVTFTNAAVTAGAPTAATATSLTVPVSIAASATVGPTNVRVTTGAEVVILANGFIVSAGTPVISQVNPNSGQQGASSTPVTITGNFTHFGNSSVVTFANAAVTAGAPTAATGTSLTVPVSIMAAASLGATNVTVTTGAEVVTLNNGFTVSAGAPVLLSVLPNTAPQGQNNLSVAITGQFTHFAQGASAVSFGSDVTVTSVTVASATGLTVNLTIPTTASLGGHAVGVTTGSEVVTLANGFTVSAPVNQAPVASAGPNQTVIQTSELFVAAQTINSILRFDGISGAFLNAFAPGVNGLINPDATVFGPDGNLYVTVQPDPAIQSAVLRYNGITGAFIDAFVSQGSGGLIAASFLTFGPDGNLYVSDYQDGTVKRYSGHTGAFIDVFATGAVRPQGLQFGPDGNLYLADQVNILRYNGTTGVSMGVFVAAGTGGLNTPQGLVFGPDGNLYESEYFNSVRRYDGSTGAFIDVFVPSGSGGVVSPSGIAFGPDGNFYVGDQSSDGQVLRYDGTTGAFLNVFIPPGSGGTTSTENQHAVGGITFRTTATTTLQGIITDDGLPPGSNLTATWSEVSGPGPVTFGTPSFSVSNVPGQMNPVVTSAGFGVSGTYQLQLSASDSQLASASTVTVSVSPSSPSLISAVPNTGQQGQQNLSLAITGQDTHFVQGTSVVSFSGTGIAPGAVTVTDGTHLSVLLTIAATAPLGAQAIQVVTGTETASLANAFTVTAGMPAITQANPSIGQQGQQNLSVNITGQLTHFAQGTSAVSFGSDITVNSVVVASQTSLTVNLTIPATANLGGHTVAVTTGSEVATLSNGFTVSAPVNQAPVVSAGANQTVIKPELFIAANNSNRVLQFDGTSGTFIDEFVSAGYGGLYWPDGVIFGPDHNLYVTSATNPSNTGPREVLRYDGTTGAFIDTFVAPGSGGLQVATYQIFGPDGNLYVSDYGDGTVKRYNGSTGAFMDVFATGAAFPQGLQFGPDSNLYVAEQLDVRRYNGTTGAFMDLFVPAGSGGLNQPQGLVFGPDGNLYLSGFFSAAVFRYNGSTGAFIDIFASGNGLVSPQGMAFGPDGNFYVGDVNNGQVLRFDGTTGAFLSVFVPAGSQGLTGSPNALAAITFRAVTLQGSMSDDGLPSGSLLTGTWSEISGPGAVTFDNPTLSVSNVAGKVYPVQTSVGFGSTGTYVLRLTASDSQLSGSADVTITVNPPLPPLSVTFVSPNSGQQGQQNLSVSLTGQGTNWVQGTTQASFGSGITVTSLTVVGLTSATAVISIDPAAAVGAYTVTLTTGSEVDTLTGGFNVTGSAPISTLTSVSPNAGPQGQGGPVAIVGQNTHFAQGTTQVSFGPGITVSNINVTCPTCLTVQLLISPTASLGPVTVTVTTGAEVATLTNGFTILAGTPILTSLTPAGGQQGQTLAVTITGQDTHFAEATTQVSFGAGITVSNISVSSTTSLTAQLAIAANATVGAYSLTVTTGSEVVSVANVFNVTVATPIVLSLNPGGGQQGQTNLSVAITGLSTHWVQGTSQASFGAGVTVTSFTVGSLTTATAVVNIDPAAMVGGRTVTVTTNSEVASFTKGFTIAAGVPSIQLVNPNTGQQGQQNLSIQVTGGLTHFAQGTTTASFGAGVTITSLTISSTTSATAVVNIDPAASVGLRDVTLTTGSEAATLAGGFAVNPGPSISQVNPGSGTAGQQNLSVTITGQYTHFAQGTTTASFGAGITVASLTVTSTTAATAVLSIDPAATAGARTVTLTTGAEVATVTNGFTVGAAATPTLTQVNPNTGLQAQQNLAVTIAGQATHFAQGTTQVSFGAGITVNSVTVASATALTANISVAASAATGSRTVTATTGTEVATLTNGFTVNTGGPVITIAPTWSDTLPNQLTITYTVTDASLAGGGTLTVSWQSISGPGTVGFQNQTPTSIMANFSQAGTYVLQISANDPQLSATQDLTVTVTGTALPPPNVSIATPADGSSVTTQVSVTGTVSSPALASWTLQYEVPGGTVFQTLATGTGPVTNGVLGTFDPTLLLNGIAFIQLQATDTSGQTSTFGPISVVVTKNQKIGNFTVSFIDLTVPTAGLPLQVIRTYDSRNKMLGDFGVGWTLGISNVQATESQVTGAAWTGTSSGGAFPTYCVQAAAAHVLTVTLPDGTTYAFDVSLTPQCQQLVPPDQVTIGFTPEPGTIASLSVMGGNQATVSGAFPGPLQLYNLNTGQLIDASQLVLTLPDGRALTIGLGTGLQSIKDLNGNTITITPGGIVHSDGKSVIFQRDVYGRITQITDPSGNVLQYAFDGNGNLSTFTDPANNVTTFTYDSNHGLLNIQDPLGIQPIRNVYDSSGRLIQTIDAFGHVINYNNSIGTSQVIVTDQLGNQTVNAYDADGNIVQVTDALGGVTLRTYDANDNLLTETNPLGETRTYTYDSQNNRLSETDPLGDTTAYTYNSLAEVLTTTDPLGRLTTNRYDANGNLLSTQDAASNVTTYAYNSSGQRTSMADPLGDVTNYQYDGYGNLTQQTDALGHVTTYTYDANGNKLSQTQTRTTSSGPQTLLTSYQYDSLNRLLQTTYPDGSTSQIQYNPIGKQSVTIDQLGRPTSYTYDAMGRLSQTTYPDGTSESSGYDAEGDRTSSTDRAGRTTTYAYDPLKRLTMTTYADGATAQTAYDAASEVTRVTDARGNITQYAYDNAGRRTSVTDALNHSTSFVYDAAGNQSSMTDANGNRTQYRYDLLNRRIRVTYADATFDSMVYDALGRTTSKTDQAGVITQFQYDKLGRLTQVTDALSQITSYAYDEVGNRVSQTDANSHTTAFAYDPLGRRIQRTLPLGMSEAMTYDAAGNLKTKTDFNGKTTTYTYDAVNRLTGKVPDASFGAPTVGFSYTATGQRQMMTDASGTTNYTYDLRDRLTQKATPEGTLSYAYDPEGNLLSISSSNTGGTSVNYMFDALNRVSTVKNNAVASGTTTYSYDNLGNLLNYLYPNSVQTTYQYNTLNRLTNVTLAQGGTLASYAYTLGPAGNRTQVAEFGGRQVNYTYDALYRLTGEIIAGGSVNGAIGYQYDAVGNRLQRTSSVTPVPVAASSYDPNDRLTTDSYDQDGNTIASGTNTYAYDFENHLQTENSGGITIVYDGDGNRVSKTAGGITTKYLVDDRNLTGYAQVLEEISGGMVQRVYTYGLNRISQSQPSGTSFYGYDGQGSVRLLTDSTGAVTDRYDYDAFGNIISQVGATPNVYLYSGEQNDPNLGFYYLRARYLNAGSGRFVTGDPSLGKTFDPRTLHRYTYAASNPVNLVDPSGRQYTLPELSISVSILEILSLSAFDLVKESNTVLIVLNLDRPGFLAQNSAISAISETDDPTIIAAAQNLYAKGGQLIGLASADVAAVNAIADLASAALTYGRTVASAIFAEQHLARAGGAVLIGLSASDLLRKGFQEQAAGRALSTALGMPQETLPVPALNEFYNALLDFFSYAGDALIDLLENQP